MPETPTGQRMKAVPVDGPLGPPGQIRARLADGRYVRFAPA